MTRAEFQTIYDQGPDAVYALLTTLQEQIVALKAEVKDLRDRLDKDSHNSSKPPSSDGLAKKPVSLRSKTGRKPGGQKGHPGRTLAWVENPDAVLTHTPPCCAGCGTTLAGVEGVDVARRQVLDLPPLALLATEHRVQKKVCPQCGQETVATFPSEVSHRVLYGPRLKALGVYLLDFQLLPYQRIAALFADLFGASFSAGTLFCCQQAASKRLSGVLACLRQGLIHAPVAHFDETGLRVGGRLHWLHSASTNTLTYYAWHRSRGKVGMDSAGVLPHFTGRAVHDGWSSYARYGCDHALCNAHHLRELTALYEQEGQEWAQKMRSLLVEIKHAVERAKEQGEKRLHPLLEARLEGRYRKLIKQGYAANPPPRPIPGQKGRQKQNQARNLLDRLHQFQRETLAFMYDFAVPFDNNLAERDVRMMKVKQKVSGCFRTAAGTDAFCPLRSYISTLRKQGQSVLFALEHVFRGVPIYPLCEG